MKRRLFIRLGALSMVLLVAACQQAESATPLIPTEFVLPTETATATDTPTPTATYTPSPTHTATASPTPTDTATPTNTPVDTATPSITPNQTVAAAASATAEIEEAPVFSTLTPLPPGSNPPPGTPQMAADVVITERQFQEELDIALNEMPEVQNASVDFVDGGILINLTARVGASASTTAELFIDVQVRNGIATLQGGVSVPDSAPEPPEEFILFATNDFFLKVVEVFDRILKQRVGDTQNLERMVVSDNAIGVMLLVPLQ